MKHHLSLVSRTHKKESHKDPSSTEPQSHTVSYLSQGSQQQEHHHYCQERKTVEETWGDERKRKNEKQCQAWFVFTSPGIPAVCGVLHGCSSTAKINNDQTEHQTEHPTDTAMPKLLFALVFVWVTIDITAHMGCVPHPAPVSSHKIPFKAF